MQKFLNIISLLMDVDADPKKAGGIAGAILGGALIICVMALVFKKILLNRKYKDDEEYIKEYKKKLKDKNKQTADKPSELTEDF